MGRRSSTEAGERRTAREYAAERGINASTLRWWASTLRREGRKGPAFVDVTAQLAPVSEVVVGKACIRVATGFDPAHLRDVVAALEER